MNKRKKNRIKNILKRWNLKDTINGVLIGIIVTIFAMWLQNRFADNQKEKNQKKVTPEILFEFYEHSDSAIDITFQSINKESSKIDKLFLKFDIPGIYQNYNVLVQDKVEKIYLKSNLLSGHGGKTTSESITLECSTIYSSGLLRIRVKYKPTGHLVQKLDHLTSISTPLFDLHDFAPYYFYWTYNGTIITERGDFDMENLKYIKKDNLQLISHESLLKRAIIDQLTKSPNSPISKYISELNFSKKEKIKVPITDNPITIDTLIIFNDTLITKSVSKGLYNSYEEVREMEIGRRSWY